MPDSNGALTKAERDKIGDWITKVWKGDGTCPVSGHREWEVSGHLVNLHIAVPGAAISIGSPVYQNALVICKGCGFTRMFNTAVMGLTMEEPKDGGE